MYQPSLPTLEQNTSKQEVVLMIHGFGVNRAIWAELSSQLSTDYNVICPDLPGYGSRLNDIPLSIEAMSVQLVENYRTLYPEGLHWVGHSMGGYIALAAYAQAPDMFKSLTLFHSHPFEDGIAKKQQRQKAVDFVSQYGSRLFAEELITGLFNEEFLKNHRDVIQHWVREAQKVYPATFQKHLESMMNRPDRSHLVKNMTIPLHCVVGALDLSIPIEQSLVSTTLAPHTTLSLNHHLAHMSMIEDPHWAYHTMLEFLSFVQSKKSKV